MSRLSGPAFLDEDGWIPASAMPPGGSGGVSITEVYRVGDIKVSTSPVNPGTYWPTTTWVQIGQNKVLIGQDPNDPDFDTAEETGGSKTAIPTGTVSTPTFTGSSSQATSAVSAGTPAGSVSAPTFTGTSGIATSAISAGTPAGSVTAPTFTGSSVSTSSDSAGTPAGTNSAPTFTGSALATHSHELPFIKVAGGTGQLAMIASSVFGTGTSRAPESISAAPTANTTSAAVEKSQAVTAGTPAGTVSAPTFTGNALSAHSHTVTTAGTNSAPAFTGSALGTHSHTVTPTGTNSAPTFTGSALGAHQHTLTPAGTVSQPTFTGDAISIVQPYLVVYFFKRTA